MGRLSHRRFLICGLIGMNDAFSDSDIELARGGAQSALNRFGVASGYRVAETADSSFERGADRLVTKASLLVCLDALNL